MYLNLIYAIEKIRTVKLLIWKKNSYNAILLNLGNFSSCFVGFYYLNFPICFQKWRKKKKKKKLILPYWDPVKQINDCDFIIIEMLSKFLFCICNSRGINWNFFWQQFVQMTSIRIKNHTQIIHQIIWQSLNWKIKYFFISPPPHKIILNTRVNVTLNETFVKQLWKTQCQVGIFQCGLFAPFYCCLHMGLSVKVDSFADEECRHGNDNDEYENDEKYFQR